MGKLIGDLKITGRLGGLSFYENTKGEIIVRGPGGPSKEQVKNGDNFDITRRNNSEFGRASATSKLLRDAIPSITKYCKEPDLHNRLGNALRGVMNTDTKSAWGERMVSAGKVQLLEDFQWNGNLSLEQALNTDCAGFIDPATGKMQVIIASFDPKEAVHAPANATHYQLSAAAIAGHPEQGKKKAEIVSGPMASIKGSSAKSLTLDITLDGSGYTILVLGLAITFFETANGKKVPIAGGAFQILKAEKLSHKEKKKPVVEPEATEPTQPALQQSLFG